MVPTRAALDETVNLFEGVTDLSSEAIAANRIATAQFSGSSTAMDVTGKEAVPVSATALSAIPEDATGFPSETVWQLNRATITAPTLEQEITTRGGDRLWVPANIHDWTGCTTVYLNERAAPALYGCETAQEVLTKSREGKLQVLFARFNMRGVLRLEDSTMRKTVLEMKPSPKAFNVSSAALRATRGLAPVMDSVAQAAPADRIVSNPMLGMCLTADPVDEGQVEKDLVACYRAYVLVTGTEQTVMKPLVPGITDMEKQDFIVFSKNVKCLLSDGSVPDFDLECYCDWANSLNYRLDHDTGIARISNVKRTEEGRLVASVEHIDKVSPAELGAVQQAMTVEWKTALTRSESEALDEALSPAGKEFYEKPPRKVQRVLSDPHSPMRTA